MDAKTGTIITNVLILEINNEYGNMVFEPISGAGEYYIYFLPYQRDGLLYWGQIKYLNPKKMAREPRIADTLARALNCPSLLPVLPSVASSIPML